MDAGVGLRAEVDAGFVLRVEVDAAVGLGVVEEDRRIADIGDAGQDKAEDRHSENEPAWERRTRQGRRRDEQQGEADARLWNKSKDIAVCP